MREKKERSQDKEDKNEEEKERKEEQNKTSTAAARLSRRLLAAQDANTTSSSSSTSISEDGRGGQTERRQGEDELNGVGPEDRPVKHNKNKPTSPAAEGEEHGNKGPSDEQTPTHRSILPRPSAPKAASGSPSSTSAPLVRIPDSRMPPPPTKDYVVRAFIWHPCGDESISEKEPKKHSSKHADCQAVPVKMTAICDEYECSMADFQSRMEQRIEKTGTWSELCGVKKGEIEKVTADVVAAHTALVDTEGGQQQVAPSARSHTLRWFLIILLAVLIYAGVVKYRQMQASQRGDEYVSVSQREFVNEATPLSRRIY